MGRLIIVVFLIAFYPSFAQETIVKSEVNEVTVFIEGAQIVRKKNMELKPGITLLKFTDLSPFIESKSVQVKANGNVTVLAVNHQQNYIDKLEKPKEIVDLETSLEDGRNKMEIVKTRLAIIAEELMFLQDNRNIGGKNQTLHVTDLKSASDFYSERLTSLKLKEIEYKKNLKELSEKEKNILDQISTVTSKTNYASGEVIIKIEAKNSTRVDLELSYLVGNAGWFPSYDIRAKDVNEPLELIYKANVKQDTKVDWKNVQLRFSSANPNISGTAPELQTYYLDYQTSPPRYQNIINEVSGIVFDNNNEPLPGVNVIVKGSTIGTTTNFDGFYSIVLPSKSSILEFSYIGFEPKSMKITNPVQNIYLSESVNALEEIVVTGYGGKEKTVSDQLQGKTAGIKIRGAISNSIPLEKIEKQTTVDFKINIPYTIKSDNKSYSVDMTNYNVPANYQYYAIPKIGKDVFLIAKINNWEQYNMLEGEANIFFGNTFIGKTIMDVRYVVDTLEVSLGRDKNVSINREKITDYSSSKFVGTRKEEARTWHITVKNNKSSKINMLVLDQIPVSRLDEIKVEIGELSGAKLNPETGEIKWDLNLVPNEKKEFNLKYSVKYPKNRALAVE